MTIGNFGALVKNDQWEVRKELDNNYPWDQKLDRCWGWSWVKKREEILREQLLRSEGYIPLEHGIVLYQVQNCNDVCATTIPSRAHTNCPTSPCFQWLCRNMCKFNKRKSKLKTFSSEQRRALVEHFATPCASNDLCPCRIFPEQCKKQKRGGRCSRRRTHDRKSSSSSSIDDSCCCRCCSSSSEDLSCDYECCRRCCCCCSSRHSSIVAVQPLRSRLVQTRQEMRDENVQVVPNIQDNYTQTAFIHTTDQSTSYETKMKKHHKKRCCCCCCKKTRKPKRQQRRCCCCCCCNGKKEAGDGRKVKNISKCCQCEKEETEVVQKDVVEAERKNNSIAEEYLLKYCMVGGRNDNAEVSQCSSAQDADEKRLKNLSTLLKENKKNVEHFLLARKASKSLREEFLKGIHCLEEEQLRRSDGAVQLPLPLSVDDSLSHLEEEHCSILDAVLGTMRKYRECSSDRSKNANGTHRLQDFAPYPSPTLQSLCIGPSKSSFLFNTSLLSPRSDSIRPSTPEVALQNMSRSFHSGKVEEHAAETHEVSASSSSYTVIPPANELQTESNFIFKICSSITDTTKMGLESLTSMLKEEAEKEAAKESHEMQTTECQEENKQQRSMFGKIFRRQHSGE